MQQVATKEPGLAPTSARGAHFRAGPEQPRELVAPLWGRLHLPGWLATAAAAVAATVLTWRWQPWPPVRAGLSSWQLGLSLAFEKKLQWGPQVVFTFGPYGFLENVVPSGDLTAGLALAYGFAVRFALAWLVVSALRRCCSSWLAGAGAWLAVGIAANLAEAPALASVLALGLALRALGGPGLPVLGGSGTGQRHEGNYGHGRLSLLALLGGLAGLQLLVEVNSGLVCAGLALVASLFSSQGAKSRLAGAVATLAALAGVAFTALAAAGQSLRNLPSYFRGELAVAIGYTPAMSLSTGRVAEDFFALVDLALLAGLAAWALRGRAWQQMLAISICLAGWSWEVAKEGYVRHDLHDLTFLGLVTAALALAGSRVGRSRREQQAASSQRAHDHSGWFAMSAQLGAVAVAAALACVANGGPPTSLVSPLESARSLVRQVVDIMSPKDWEAVEATAKRQAARNGDALPGRLLSALATHSFAVEPLEDSMSFAYPALRRWDPEPVLQAYSAYTAYLDHLDSAFLASSRAPELILYRPVPTNDFDPAWEPPAASEELYCRYAEVETADYWALLRRVPDRCGKPVAIGSATAHFGEPVDVPKPPAAGDMVIARFSLTLPALTRVANLLWKAPAVRAETWSGKPFSRPSTWRFVSATAGDDHVLYTPPALGWTAGYGPPAVGKLELTGGGWRPGQGTVRISFFAVHLRTASRRGR